MKQLFFILLLLPGLLYAQIDPKYAAGKVPVENGKVVFHKDIIAPGMSQNSLMANALTWANGQFIEVDDFHSRILYSDIETGQIACLGEQYLVFKDKSLSLDRAVVTYQFSASCEDGKCHLKISAIRYKYNFGGKDEIISAEDQITDENTITKKNKLLRSTGKFRTHTIDMVENIFASAEKAIAGDAISTKGSQPTAEKNVSQNVAAQQAANAAVSVLPIKKKTYTPQPISGYKQITPDKIPGNIYQLLSESHMLITAGNDKEFNMMTAGWGGLGHFYNKPAAFCFIHPGCHTMSLMENNDTYTLSFYTATYNDALQYCGTHSGKDVDKVAATGLTPITTPRGSKAFSEAWMIIECKKMAVQTITSEGVIDTEAKAQWGNMMPKMFIGEIINVWVK